MDAVAMVTDARDTLTVKRVFGEPITQNGVTVVPVARITGGGGAGSGEPGADQNGSRGGSGSGGGFGLGVSPAGVFVIRDDSVSWRPAVNVNRIVLGGQLVAVVALLVARSYLKALARRSS